MIDTVLALALVAVAAQHAPPETRYIVARDGTRIAYDVTGAGPAIMLLHGGGQTRRVWHETGYVQRLASEYTVITVDLRGSGESDKPTTVDAYGLASLTADLLTVADSAGVQQFGVWGFSYGANVGRYLARASDRVRRLIYVGVPFGAPVDSAFRRFILGERAKWVPILAAARAGSLNPDTLAAADQRTWARGTVAVNLAWLTALIDYPILEPQALGIPTLWVVGGRNMAAMESLAHYRSSLGRTRVQVLVLDGLSHPEEMSAIDRVFPEVIAFIRSTRF